MQPDKEEDHANKKKDAHYLVADKAQYPGVATNIRWECGVTVLLRHTGLYRLVGSGRSRQLTVIKRTAADMGV